MLLAELNKERGSDLVYNNEFGSKQWYVMSEPNRQDGPFDSEEKATWFMTRRKGLVRPKKILK